jgi:6-pyruvoyl-tetrahydropterin synthase
MVMDFSCLSEVIEVIHARVDHRVLNKVLGYKPTAENMVLRFGEEIKTLLPEGVFLDCVRLWETPTSFAEYLVGGSPCRTCDCQS